ncbi:MAG: OmpA family protein [Elusimicrobiota bacterium]|nr:OmpA family protein [Elusimicrobiota bacterium]
MKRKFVWMFAGVLFVPFVFLGCQGAAIDYEGIDDAALEIDIEDESGTNIETVVIDEGAFQEEPNVRIGQQEVISEIRTVHFNFDSNALTGEAQKILRDNAAYLLANPNVNVVVEGHCDNRGTVAYNLALGQRRAMRVKEFYVSLGVPPNRVATISYGKEQPVEFGDNEMAWAANRRAETKVISQ